MILSKKTVFSEYFKEILKKTINTVYTVEIAKKRRSYVKAAALMVLAEANAD